MFDQLPDIIPHCCFHSTLLGQLTWYHSVCSEVWAAPFPLPAPNYCYLRSKDNSLSSFSPGVQFPSAQHSRTPCRVRAGELTCHSCELFWRQLQVKYGNRRVWGNGCFVTKRSPGKWNSQAEKESTKKKRCRCSDSDSRQCDSYINDHCFDFILF